ncbi:PREDICTED: bifunctional heparan sulfate N-deacetylase/N-sulfotransferase-like [Amphimedon queenslandica]|uniref:[heparan sulfate]-glucosamine N-sulfotransferase n=1 Tax=Amphimedon queenslandica TaxID=400682 RepID=A0A1X7UFS6_AMPQE|nr:PREDICTED: bifunctional heparan sulfate N-deacetylase/N-sulfotransferase-like [Amphimedon queenslandica]|eukprot:XP_019854532.1 PREDICTED: bifunctional heparan sulfate N-deacetylase/N-sulfotransferase-like [Amphimedon queenslandica]
MVVPILLRRMFLVSLSLCVLVPVFWILMKREDKLESISTRTGSTIRNINRDSQPLIDSLMVKSSDRPVVNKSHVEPGVLVLYKYRSNSELKIVRSLLQAHRIQHETYVMSTSRHIPKLVRTDLPVIVGRYRLVIVLDVFNFISEPSIHELFTEYCQRFDAVMILVASGKEKIITSVLGKQVFENDINLLTLSQSVHINYLKVHQADDFVYAKDGGEWNWKSNDSSLISFLPHRISPVTGKSVPYSPKVISKRIQVLASVHFLHNGIQRTLPVAIIDRNSTDGVQRVFFGTPMSLSIAKLLLLDVMHMFSKSYSIMRLSKRRWIQIDIDDTFVAPLGSKMTDSDVKVLLKAQQTFQNIIPGFKFNLGYCGELYRVGLPSETKGDEMLVSHSEQFNWFGHTFAHTKTHTLSLNELHTLMKLNQQFAKNYSITVNSHYSVSPHHSGIYPIHEPLYTAWRDVWDILVTSTEEYPHLRPDHMRKGFIHSKIKVLPRQTCHLFTHITKYEDIIGGRDQLIAYAEGDVFSTILYNPVSIFMTHSGNYAKDHLALDLFSLLFDFIRKWTQIELVTDTPINLANAYFEIFPEDKQPVWTSPCQDKRHMSIWSGRNCSQLPSLVILGPQKSGSTALHFFLKQHPRLLTNPMTTHAFEEVQFFSSDLYYNKGVDWYISNFPTPNSTSTGTLVFEKSATYFTHLLAPERMRMLIPKAKLVVILADPIKRAYSWYQHVKFHNDPTALIHNFTSVIKASRKNSSSQNLLNLRSRCLLPGIYHEHLERWLEYFPQNQIYFVDGGELVDNPINVLLGLVEFIGVEYLDFGKILKFNPKKGFYCVVSSSKRSRTICLGRSKGRQYPALSKENTQYLERYYSAHNRKLYQMLMKMSRRPPTWLMEEASYRQIN